VPKYLLLVAALMGATTSAHAGAEVSHFILANGLEVVVVPDHRAPVVTHMIWYKVGAADETPGKSGLAHFLEHLMFKGTEKNPGDAFSRQVAEIGGQENAFTASDYTGFFQRVPRNHLKEMMVLEADRITGLVLTDDVVRPELNVVLEEQNMRVANNPAARLGEQMDAALYLNHPYGRPVKADAEATYGKIADRADTNPRHRPMEPLQEAPRTVTLADLRVEQPSVSRDYLVPSEISAKPGESEALEVLAHVLGSGENCRLYRALVVERGLALNAGATYSGTAVDYAKFAVFGVPKPGVSLPQLEAAIDGILAELIAQGVSGDELERAKTRLIAEAVYAEDNQATLARWYGSALATGQTAENVRAWPDRIRAVTAEAVQNAARTWLDRRRSVTGYLVKTLQSEEKRS